MKTGNTINSTRRRGNAFRLSWEVCALAILAFGLWATIGCRTKPASQNKEYFTSGSREADQRASQRMAKAEELAGSGEGASA